MRRFKVYIVRGARMITFPLMTLSQAHVMLRSEFSRPDKADRIAIGNLNDPTHFVGITIDKE